MKRFFVLLLFIINVDSNAQILINEFSAHKGVFDENNIETDWIELFNNSNQVEDLSNYFLSDDLNNLEKWQLPNILLEPYQYIIFYASSRNTQFFDGENNFYHTNFKLSPSEYITLYNNNEIIDSTFINNELYFGISMGKYPDGSNQWCYFNNSTPNSSNLNSICFSDITNQANTNIESGWYDSTQTIILEPHLNSTVYYTTDGSIPTINDILYNQPFNVNENTILSFRSFSNNKLPSKINDRTFIFEEDNHELAVFSIHTDPINLWSIDSGIYVSGTNASSDYPYYGSNFWQPWSRFSRIEYFDKNKFKKAYENIDLEIHGGWSRAEPQKSFRIDLKSKYTGRLNEILIPSKSNIESYNNFNLRNGGQHTWTDKIQDAIISRIASETNVNYMAYEPCITYLNGEYWGIYGIREKIDEHYIEDNYGFNSDSVDLLNSFGVLIGSDINAINTYYSIINEDPESIGFYELFSSHWNIENYIDYFIIQTFIQNMDWLGIAWGANNIKLWRPQTEDGKWNYVLYDTDGALGYFGQSYYENYLSYAMNPLFTNEHSQIFNHVIQNQVFKCEFANRYADLINTVLSYENVEEKANIIKNDIYNAMPRHIDRWQNYDNLNGTINSMIDWENSIDNILDFYSNRIDPARYFVGTTLNLNGMLNISLDLFPVNSGKIDINTISINNFPWQGIYYNECDISLNAIADSGYSFKYWTDFNDNIISENNNIQINLNQVIELKAHFEKCEDILNVSIYSENNNIYASLISSNDQNTYLWYQNDIPYSTDSILYQPPSGIYHLEVSNNSCSITSNNINYNVNIDELNDNLDLNIYPNPFVSQAVLDLSKFQNQKLKISITDMKGRLVRQYNEINDKKFIIKKEKINSGIYFIEVKSQTTINRIKVAVN